MPPIIYAHRGASGQYPENTMEAFQAAVKKRAHGIELDVQLTKDDKLAVIHDHILDRTTSGSGFVRNHTMEELRKYRADKDSSLHLPRARIPALREVFQRFAQSPIRFSIEMKNLLFPQPQLEEKLIEMIRRFQLTERTVISSFNFDSLSRIKELDPFQSTALLYVGALKSPWEIATRYQADELHVPYDQLSPELVAQAHAHDYPVIVWTVNSEGKIRESLAMGVDGIITNYPGRARKVWKSLRLNEK